MRRHSLSWSERDEAAAGRGILVSGLVFIAIVAAACGSPGSSVVPDERSISLVHLWSVGDGEGEENVVCTTDTMLAGPSSGGRFYVAPTCIPGQVATLDASGDITGFFGSRGEGPGQLNMVATIFVDPLDRLHVFEVPRGHTVFDSSQQFVGASDALPLSFWVLFLEGKKSVRNLRLRAPERAGKTLHLVDDQTDAVLASFGDEGSAGGVPSDGRRLFRSVASGNGATFWSARSFEFVLEEWDPSGERIRTITRRPEWWVEKPGTNGTWVRDIVFREGLLWVISLVPTFDGDALPAGVGADPELNDYYDTVIEAIDVETEQVVAMLRREEGFNRWVGDLVFSFRDVGDGGVAMDVWRTTLSEPERP